MSYDLRDIRPDDKDALVRFHAQLSADTRYRRYHALKGDLTRGDLRYLTEVDGRSHVALVAEDDGELLGVARVVAYPDREGEAEVAVVVRDDVQAEGVGRDLVEGVLRRARDTGVERVVAEVQADNHRALRFFQGFGGRQRAAGGIVRELVIPTRQADPQA